MKIWIYFNGLQQGPYTFEQIKLLPIEPTTPVWYEGLAQWTPAGEAPLTAPLFESAEGEEGAAERSSEAEAAELFGVNQSAGQSAWASQSAAKDDPNRPPKPSTHMVWCILLTILCCSPFAIAGIVTGSLSTSRYNEGRYKEAKSLSEATEWLVIISIVWAFIGLPVSLIFSNL